MYIELIYKRILIQYLLESTELGGKNEISNLYGTTKYRYKRASCP